MRPRIEGHFLHRNSWEGGGVKALSWPSSFLDHEFGPFSCYKHGPFLIQYNVRTAAFLVSVMKLNKQTHFGPRNEICDYITRKYLISSSGVHICLVGHVVQHSNVNRQKLAIHRIPYRRRREQRMSSDQGGTHILVQCVKGRTAVIPRSLIGSAGGFHMSMWCTCLYPWIQYPCSPVRHIALVCGHRFSRKMMCCEFIIEAFFRAFFL